MVRQIKITQLHFVNNGAKTKNEVERLLWVHFDTMLGHGNVSRKPQYKDVRRTIEIPQRAHTFNVSSHLKVHNAHLELASPISG